jgi:hypothetical protein
LKPLAGRLDPSVRVHRIEGFSAEREEVERHLAEEQVPLPVPQRAAWIRAAGRRGTLLLVARDASGLPLCAMGVGISRSRALPGHRIYRVERWSEGPSPEACGAILATLLQEARRDPLCLRVIVEVCDRDADARIRMGDSFRVLGFSRSPTPRMYDRTLAVDLGRSEQSIFGALNKTARRHIRAADKRGLHLRPIIDPSLDSRLAILTEQTFARTHASFDRHPWGRIIELSAREPTASRIVGLFDPSRTGPESLISFAWGCAHGSYAAYEAGAADRRPDLGSLPLGYAPLWDLITWARNSTTATWFDLGGVSSGEPGDERAGIVHFKRLFSEEFVEVGEEWILEPHFASSRLARVLSATARWVLRRGQRLTSLLRS